MLISVRVIPGARSNEVLKLGEGAYKVKVTTIPEKGKANIAVQKLLAKHLGLSKSKLTLVKGEASQDKVFEIIA